MAKKSVIGIIIAVLLLLLLAVLVGGGYYVYLRWFKITTKYETVTSVKPFQTITKEDPNLEKDQRKVETEGKNGTIKTTYKLVYKGKKLISKKKIKEVVIKKPVDEVVLVGTKAPYPSTPEDLIRAYYKAINDHRWEEAWGYLSAKWQAVFYQTNPPPEERAYAPGLERFQHSYEDYVRSVSVTSVERLTSPPVKPDEYVYGVSFDADYIKPYPAGSHKLPPIHSLVQDPATSRWKINEFGTGL